MGDIYLINEKILNFYTNVTNEKINFKNKEDRIKLSATILKYCNDDLSHYPDILKTHAQEFYDIHELDELFTREFYELLKFMFYCLINETYFKFDDALKHELICIITDIQDEVYKTWNFEISNDSIMRGMCGKVS